MIQETSKESYNVLEKKDADCLTYLTKLYETGKEAPDYIMGLLLHWDNSRVSARRNDLVKRGIVEDSGSKVNHWMKNEVGSSFKRKVIVWKVTEMKYDGING